MKPRAEELQLRAQQANSPGGQVCVSLVLSPVGWEVQSLGPPGWEAAPSMWDHLWGTQVGTEGAVEPRRLLPILPLPPGSHEHRLLQQLRGETQKEQLHGPWSPPSSWRGCGRI